MIRWRELFLGRRDAMATKLAIGLVANAGLFAHGFAANPLLARFADSPFQYRRWFGAYHAFFDGRFSHRRILPEMDQLPMPQLMTLIC